MAGGDHGVSVFLGVCCLLFLYVVHKVTVLVIRFESTIVLLGFVVSHRWFDGFETNFHT